MSSQMKFSKKNSNKKSIKQLIRHKLTGLSKNAKKFMSSKIFVCFLTILLASILSFLLIFKWSPSSSSYKVGDVVRGNIKAPYDLEVVDEIATRNRMQINREKILPRYDIDLSLISDISARIKNAFDTLHQQILSSQNTFLKEKELKVENSISKDFFVNEVVHSPSYLKAEIVFEKNLGGNFPPKLLFFFRKNIFSFSIAENMKNFVKQSLPREIVSDRQLYVSHLVKGIFVKDIATGDRVKISSSIKPVELRELEKIVLVNVNSKRYFFSFII